MALYCTQKHTLYINYGCLSFINRRLLKISVILLPLLGITWVFGVLAVNQESSVFAWIFAILNSLQVRHVKLATITYLLHYPLVVKILSVAIHYSASYMLDFRLVVHYANY